MSIVRCHETSLLHWTKETIGDTRGWGDWLEGEGDVTRYPWVQHSSYQVFGCVNAMPFPSIASTIHNATHNIGCEWETVSYCCNIFASFFSFICVWRKPLFRWHETLNCKNQYKQCSRNSRRHGEVDIRHAREFSPAPLSRAVPWLCVILDNIDFVRDNIDLWLSQRKQWEKWLKPWHNRPYSGVGSLRGNSAPGDSDTSVDFLS